MWHSIRATYEAWEAMQVGVAPNPPGEEPPRPHADQFAAEDACAAAWPDYIAARNALFGLTP